MIITAGAAIGLSHDVFSGVQNNVADRYVFPRGHVDDSIVVVGIDAHSLAETGESWPWSRATQAELVSKLHDDGARVIALDLLYASAEPGDDELGRAMAQAGNVVVAEAADVPGSAEPSNPADVYAADGALEATSAVRPVKAIGDAAAEVGHVAITPDAIDGVTRRVPLVVEDHLHLVPAFSLAVLAAATNTTNSAVLQAHGGVQLGSLAVPTDDHYGLRVSYAKGLLGGVGTDGQTPHTVSAVDVMQGRVTDFRDKVVFVGAIDQTLGDNHAIPMGRRGGVPGVFVHANAYNTMVTKAYLEPASTTATLITIFLLTVIVGLAVQFLPMWAAALASVSCLAGYALFFVPRAQAGTISNLVYPVLAIILVVPLSGAVRYTFIERRRRLVASLFSQYVPDAVAADLVHRGLVESAIAGNRMDVTVLFCDIRGFTALTARVGAGQIRSMLDRYYEYVSDIVLAHGGTVVQFVGDEVFAVFGAPVADPDHATNAIASACSRCRNGRRSSMRGCWPWATRRCGSASVCTRGRSWRPTSAHPIDGSTRLSAMR